MRFAIHAAGTGRVQFPRLATNDEKQDRIHNSQCNHVEEQEN
jgi:hypothetical protein